MNEWSDDDLQHDVSEARWVAENIVDAPATTVGSLVPVGYDAYARILYPVYSPGPGGERRLVRWSDIARHTGAIAHAEMELHSLEAKSASGRSGVVPAKVVAPWGDQLLGLSSALTGATSTPENCWYAIWEGNTALDPIRRITPTVQIDGYNYYLLRGPVARATDSYRGLTPNIWWPNDRAWCMVAHFDFPCVYLGGSNETIEKVLGLQDIEAWPARFDQVVTADNDQLN